MKNCKHTEYLISLFAGGVDYDDSGGGHIHVLGYAEVNGHVGR